MILPLFPVEFQVIPVMHKIFFLFQETTPFDFHTVLPSQPQIKVENFEQQFICLDAGKLKDIPAKYTVPSIEPHEFPAVGVYIDPRIATGFKYRVRRIENPVKSRTFINIYLLLRYWHNHFCEVRCKSKHHRTDESYHFSINLKTIFMKCVSAIFQWSICLFLFFSPFIIYTLFFLSSHNLHLVYSLLCVNQQDQSFTVKFRFNRLLVTA